MSTKSSNPYYDFKEWLFNKSDDELNEEILKIINPVSILGMFLKYPNLHIYLNDTFNTFDIYKKNKKEFFCFIKDIIRDNKISKWDISFVSIKSNKLKIKESIINNNIKDIKDYEIDIFDKLSKTDEDVKHYIKSYSKPKKTSKKTKK